MNDFTQEAQLRSVYEICLDHSLGIINAEDAMKAIGGVILHRQLYYSKKLAKAVQAAEERKHNDTEMDWKHDTGRFGVRKA